MKMMEHEVRKENTKAVDDDDDDYTIITVASTTVVTQQHGNDGDDDKEQKQKQKQQLQPSLRLIIYNAYRFTFTYFFVSLVMGAFGLSLFDHKSCSLFPYAFIGAMSGYVLTNYFIAMCFPTTYAKMLAAAEEEAAKGCCGSRRNDSGEDNDDDTNA